MVKLTVIPTRPNRDRIRFRSTKMAKLMVVPQNPLRNPIQFLEEARRNILKIMKKELARKMREEAKRIKD